MNGCCIPDTPIAVDYWRRRNCQAKLFFLSHMHADHTSGLSSSWKDRIYCSEISAKLLKAKFNIKDELICPLETGVSHVVDLDVMNSITMTVTLIDAHHCPGAVMFLFEGYFGTILYTGDFRFCEAMLTDLDLLSGKSINALYFDNTYNSEEFFFPSREYAQKQLMQIVEDNQNREIVLGMHSLGKEDLLVDIAKRFQTWIVISPEKMDLVKLLDLPDVFTTDISAGWIRVEKKMKITKKNMAIWNKEQDTIAILPTALYFNSQDSNTSNIHVVPYSDHSSYNELLEFVAHIKPKRLIPIVKEGDSYAKRSIIHLQHFDTYLDQSPQIVFSIPEVLRNISFNSVSTNKNLAQKTVIISGSKRKRSLGVQFYDSPEKQQMPKQPKLDDESRNDGNCAFKATNKECTYNVVEMNEDTTVMKVDENSHSLGGKTEGSPLNSVTQQKDVSRSDILYYFQRKGTTLSDNPEETSCRTSPKSFVLPETEHKPNDDLSIENNCSQNEEVILVKTETSGNSQDSQDTSELTSQKPVVFIETEHNLNDDLNTENNSSQNEEVVAVKSKTSGNSPDSQDTSELTSQKPVVFIETEHNLNDDLNTENNSSQNEEVVPVKSKTSGNSQDSQDTSELTSQKPVVFIETEHNLNDDLNTENNSSQNEEVVAVKSKTSGNSPDSQDTSELTSQKPVVFVETEHNLNDDLNTENNSSQNEEVVAVKSKISGNSPDSQDTSELTSPKPVVFVETEHNLNDDLSTENNCSQGEQLIAVNTGTSGNSLDPHDTSQPTSPKPEYNLNDENNSSQIENMISSITTGTSGNLQDSQDTSELSSLKSVVLPDTEHNLSNCLRTENNCSEGVKVIVKTGASGSSSDSLNATESSESSSSNPAEPSFNFKTCQKMTRNHRSCTASDAYRLSNSDITELLESQLATAIYNDLNSNHNLDAEYSKSLFMGIQPVHMRKTKEEKRRSLEEAFKMF